MTTGPVNAAGAGPSPSAGDLPPNSLRRQNIAQGRKTAPVVGVCAAFEAARWGFWDQRAAIVPATYLDKIAAAGAIAIGLLPDERGVGEPDSLLDRVDGLMLIGGVDVMPTSYGETRNDRTEATEPLRDAFELNLVRAAMRRDIPVLGICRGLQILNVATGGTLHQHLPDAGFAEHRPSPGRLDHETFHEVEIVSGTRAAALSGAGVQIVNSHHHQGIDLLGDGAVVTARSRPDHLPEALEWPQKRYVLGVQWHPEAAELTHVLTDFVSCTAETAPGAPLR